MGNLAFLAALGIAVAVSAAINVGVQANDVGWSNINWGGVATAAFAGGVDTAVGAPLGTWAARALGSSLLGAAIAYGTGATLANSKLRQALTEGLNEHLEPKWSSGIAAGLFSSTRPPSVARN